MARTLQRRPINTLNFPVPAESVLRDQSLVETVESECTTLQSSLQRKVVHEVMDGTSGQQGRLCVSHISCIVRGCLQQQAERANEI